MFELNVPESQSFTATQQDPTALILGKRFCSLFQDNAFKYSSKLPLFLGFVFFNMQRTFIVSKESFFSSDATYNFLYCI